MLFSLLSIKRQIVSILFLLNTNLNVLYVKNFTENNFSNSGYVQNKTYCYEILLEDNYNVSDNSSLIRTANFIFFKSSTITLQGFFYPLECHYHWF